MDISKLSSKSLSQVTKLIKSLESIESRVASGKMLTYNFRVDNDQVLWAPIVGPLITQYKKSCEAKLSNPELDLVYRSRHVDISPLDNGFIRIFGFNSTQRLIMSDYIMFNKSCNLTLNLVDRYLPYCKFKYNGESAYQIDGWEYKCPGMFVVGSSRPNYSIKFSMDYNQYDQMKLLTSEEEKRLAVRAMIKIMNECDVEQINLENYYVISEWYHLNDHMINSYNSNQPTIKTLSSNTSPNVLTIPINNLLTKEELEEILYSNAINGSKDLNTIFGINKPKNNNLAKINVAINTQEINLCEYAKVNGLTRTNQVIEEIKHITKYRVNLDNWVGIKSNQPINKYQLISELHNRLKPYGMGILAHSSSLIDESKAQEILSNHQNYIDYLNGIAFKLDFSIYPILNVNSFENRNGSFVKCLEQFAKLK